MAYEPQAGHGLGIAIIGANGNAGKMLVEELIHAPFLIAHIRLLGNPIRGLQRIRVEEHDFPIHPWREDIADNPQLEGVHLVVLATPPRISLEIGAALRSEGLACIDLSGSYNKSGWSLSGVQVDWDLFREERYLALPGPIATLCARIMSPVLPLGAAVLRTTVLSSAAIAGTAGVGELSNQVTALFNTKTPQRLLFEKGLAFDVLPSWGVEKGGWTELEASASLELAQLLGTHPSRFVHTVNIVPTFSGVSASIHISFEQAVELEAVLDAFEQSQYIDVEDPMFGPQHWIGMNRIGVGRVRLDPLGDGVHLWVSCDELRALMSRNVVELMASMLEHELV